MKEKFQCGEKGKTMRGKKSICTIATLLLCGYTAVSGCFMLTGCSNDTEYTESVGFLDEDFEEEELDEEDAEKAYRKEINGLMLESEIEEKVEAAFAPVTDLLGLENEISEFEITPCYDDEDCDSTFSCTVFSMYDGGVKLWVEGNLKNGVVRRIETYITCLTSSMPEGLGDDTLASLLHLPYFAAGMFEDVDSFDDVMKLKNSMIVIKDSEPGTLQTELVKDDIRYFYMGFSLTDNVAMCSTFSVEYLS